MNGGVYVGRRSCSNHVTHGLPNGGLKRCLTTNRRKHRQLQGYKKQPKRVARIEASWLVQSKPHVSLLVERHHASSWPQRLLARARPRPEASRSLTGTGQELSLFVRSDVTRRAPSSSSENSPSSVWFVRSPRTSRPICVSRALPSWLSRRLPKLTWLVSSRTLTCAPSTPRE